MRYCTHSISSMGHSVTNLSVYGAVALIALRNYIDSRELLFIVPSACYDFKHFFSKTLYLRA